MLLIRSREQAEISKEIDLSADAAFQARIVLRRRAWMRSEFSESLIEGYRMKMGRLVPPRVAMNSVRSRPHTWDLMQSSGVHYIERESTLVCLARALSISKCLGKKIRAQVISEPDLQVVESLRATGKARVPLERPTVFRHIALRYEFARWLKIRAEGNDSDVIGVWL